MKLELESREITVIIQALHERNEADADAVRKKIVLQRDEQLKEK